MMKKVYILDDDSDFLEIAEHILVKDYNVKTSSELDINHLESFKPDLILMDNSIGAMDSRSMMKHMEEHMQAFAIPIILVSGHHDLPRLAKDNGFVGFIQKPASISYIRSYLADYFAA